MKKEILRKFEKIGKQISCNKWDFFLALLEADGRIRDFLSEDSELSDFEFMFFLIGILRFAGYTEEDIATFLAIGLF